MFPRTPNKSHAYFPRIYKKNISCFCPKKPLFCTWFLHIYGNTKKRVNISLESFPLQNWAIMSAKWPKVTLEQKILLVQSWQISIPKLNLFCSKTVKSHKALWLQQIEANVRMVSPYMGIMIIGMGRSITAWPCSVFTDQPWEEPWHTGFFRNMLQGYHLKHLSKNHK